MSEALEIADGRVGIIHYVLRDGDGNVLDASVGGEPLAYLAGAGNLIPGLEKELLGKKMGDQLKAEIAPADAYGELSEQEDVRVRKNELPKGRDYEVGQPIHAQGPDGNPFTLWITKMEGAWVWLTNHPLAGKTLHFDVQVMGCREASADEKTHGHAHGPDGHGHHHHH